MKFPHHGLGGQDRVHRAVVIGNSHLAAGWVAMEDRYSLSKSIEVATQFVKQYPYLRLLESGPRRASLSAGSVVSEDRARVEGIAQAIA